MNGAKVFIESMIKSGVDTTFGFPGGQVIPLFDAYLDYEDQIRNVLVRHEQAAAHAAEGYARASGRVGVCVATSGPGACNLVTGIADAYMDSVPIVAIGGQVPTRLIGNDAFQETDMIGVTLPITKHNFQIRDSKDVESTVAKAFKLSLNGRPGPVYIDFPKDVQSQKVGKRITDEEFRNIQIKGFDPTIIANDMQISRAADLMIKSLRPIILAGGGIISSNASNELREFAQLFGIPVCTTLMGKSCFDETHPLSLGIVGMHGRRIANYAMMNSDVVLVIGCRFSDRITGDTNTYLNDAKIIHIDIDPAEIGKNVEVTIPIVANAKNALSQLLEAIIMKVEKIERTDSISSASKKNIIGNPEWIDRIKKYKTACDACVNFPSKAGNQGVAGSAAKIFPKSIIDELNKIMDKDDIITTGVGQHQMFAMHYLKLRTPRTWISSGGAGTMGFGLPAAIGAKFAKPQSNVYNIDGDGSFQMSIQELETIRSNNVRLTSIIFNNSYLGMVRQWLELFNDKRYSQVNLGSEIDFAKISRAYGLEGVTVEKTSELPDALKNARDSSKATIIDVKIEEESNVLPMMTPGGNYKTVFGKCMKGPGEYF